jgi:flagellar motor switch protein FliM
VTTREARAYDLSTPAPLPREAARRMPALRDVLSEEMRVHLRRLLRLRTSVSVVAPDVARVRHFSSFLEGKAWWFSGGSRADPAGRSVLIGCAPSLIYVAIDRILGGPGSAAPSGKLPTQIEFDLGMRFLRDVFQGLAEALLLPPLHLAVAPHGPLAEPLLTYIPDLEEPFARILCKVKVLEREHELLLCVSRKLLEAAEPKGEEARVVAGQLSAPVAGAPIEVLVELARCRLAVDEAAQLTRGDVVLFDLPPGEAIDVKVQGRTRFRARLGTHDGRYAIEVTDVMERDAAPNASASKPPAKAAAAAATTKPAATPAGAASRATAASATGPTKTTAAPRPRSS